MINQYIDGTGLDKNIFFIPEGKTKRQAKSVY